MRDMETLIYEENILTVNTKTPIFFNMLKSFNSLQTEINVNYIFKKINSHRVVNTPIS